MKLTFIVLSLLLVLMSTRAFAALPNARKIAHPEKGFQCWKQMQPQFKLDGIGGGWRAKLKPDGKFMQAAPSKLIGRWWFLDKHEGKEILVRETTYERLIVRYNPQNCQAEFATLPLKAVEGGFTDAELTRTVYQNPKGLIYTWSPGMQLSVEGLKAIKEAAQTAKLPLTILLDPRADVAQAKAALQRAGLTDVSLQAMNSYELRNRNVLMHFPNLSMYRDGRVLNEMVPGLLGSGNYQAVIKKYLE